MTKQDTSKHCIDLILVAQELGITQLQSRLSEHLEKTLEQTFQQLELAEALQELYSNFRDGADIGNAVVSLVTVAAAKVCRRKIASLGQSAKFKQLLKDVPQLAVDIVDAVAEEDSVKKADSLEPAD